MVAAMRVTRPSSAREAMDVTVLLAVSSGLLRTGVPVLVPAAAQRRERSSVCPASAEKSTASNAECGDLCLKLLDLMPVSRGAGQRCPDERHSRLTPARWWSSWTIRGHLGSPVASREAFAAAPGLVMVRDNGYVATYFTNRC